MCIVPIKRHISHSPFHFHHSHLSTSLPSSLLPALTKGGKRREGKRKRVCCVYQVSYVFHSHILFHFLHSFYSLLSQRSQKQRSEWKREGVRCLHAAKYIIHSLQFPFHFLHSPPSSLTLTEGEEEVKRKEGNNLLSNVRCAYRVTSRKFCNRTCLL